MPIFEYRCVDCGNRFEELVLRSSPAPHCPACLGAHVEKLMSSTSVSSKGTRAHTLQGARERASKVRHDKEYEEHKKAHKHHH